VRSYENSVRKALLKVELGEADAAFIYSSDALSIENSHFFLLPDFAQPEIYYVAAEIFSDQGQGAQKFLNFLLAPKAQTILMKWGFELPWEKMENGIHGFFTHPRLSLYWFLLCPY